MIGRLAPGVFITTVLPAVRVVRIIEEFPIPMDGQRMLHRSIGQASDRSGDQELFTGLQDALAEGTVGHGPQCHRQELIRAHMIVRHGLGRRHAGGGMQAVRQSFRIAARIERCDGGLHLRGQRADGGIRFEACEEREGAVPQGLDLDRVAFARRAGGVVGIHPGEVGGTEDESARRIHPDPVGGPIPVMHYDRTDDVTDRSPVAVHIQQRVIARRQQVLAGDHKPQGRIRGVAVGIVAAANHVGQRALLLEAGKLTQNVATLGMHPGRNHAAQADQRIAPPIEEPGIAGDDGQ